MRPPSSSLPSREAAAAVPLPVEPLQRSGEALGLRNRLLTAVAGSLRRLLGTAGGDFAGAVHATLQELGQACGIHRVKVILQRPAPHSGELTHYLDHEWWAPGMQSQTSLGLTQFPNTLVQGMLASLQAGRSFWYLIDEVPIEVRADFARVGVQSVGAVPIFAGGEYLGLVAFDDCMRRHRWADAEIDALTTAAQGIGAAMHRNRIEQAERQRALELARVNKALSCGLNRLGSAQGLTGFVEHLLGAAIELLDGAIAQIFLFDAGGNTLRPGLGVDRQGQAAAAPGLMDGLPVAAAFAADITDAWPRLLAQRQALEFDLVRDEASFWPGTLEWHRAMGHSGSVCVALMVGDEPLGMLGLAFRGRRAFTSAELEFTQALGQQVALALQMERLSERARDVAVTREREAAAQARAAEAGVLNHLLEGVVAASRALLEGDNFDDSLRRWLSYLAEAVGSDRAMYGNLLPASDPRAPATVVIDWTRPGVPTTHGDTIPATSDFSQWASRLAQGETVWAHLEDLLDPASVDYWNKTCCRSNLIVPVRVNHESVGWLCFDWTTRREWQPAFGAVLRTAADGAAAALQRHGAMRALLAEREQRYEMQRQRTEELARASQALQKTIDAVSQLETLDAFIPQALRIAVDAFGSQSAGYFEHRGPLIRLRWWLHEGRAYSPDELPGVDERRFGLMRWLASGFCMPDADLSAEHRRQTRPMVIDHRQDGVDGTLDRSCRELSWHWEMNVPLIVNGMADGAITLYRAEAKPFTEAELSLAEALGKQIALAMQTSRIAEREREAAVAREQQEAALLRAQELAKVNAAVRRSLARLSVERSLSSLLTQLLGDMIATLGGTVAQLLRLNAANDTLVPAALYHSAGFLAGSGDASADAHAPVAEAVPAQSVPAWRMLLKQRRTVVFDVDRDAAMFWPGAQAWHLARGNRRILCVALLLGDRPLGLIGVAFAGAREITQAEAEFVEALANQAALAIEFDHLAREAEASATARAEERAARARALELQQANDELIASTSQLVALTELPEYLGRLLLSVARLCGAPSAAMFADDPEAECLQVRCFAVDGRILPLSRHSLTTPWQQPLNGASRRCCIDRFKGRGLVWAEVAACEAEEGWPERAAWHRARGHDVLACFPLEVGPDFVGYIGLAFIGTARPSDFSLQQARVLAQQAAIALQMERLARLVEQAAIRSERDRMAAEIHDSLAQSFTSIAMQSESLADRLRSHARNDPEHQRVLRLIERTARQGLAEARGAVLAMSPLDGTPGALDDALRELAERCSIQGMVSCHFESQGWPCDLAAPVREALLRIAQEAASNAIRHSGGDRLLITIVYEDPCVTLRVQDNGGGIPNATLYKGKGGFGLGGMQTRAAAVGGTLALEAASLGGLAVRAQVPCRDRQ